MKKIPKHIYHSPFHILATIGILAIPLVYLLVFSRFARITSSTLFLDVFVSAWRLVIAYIIAVLFAWLLAAGFYRGRRSTVALPFFDVMQSFPTTAALPIAAYIWGPSNFTVIFFLVITVIWPILFSIISSLKLIRHDWYEAVEISGLHGWQYVRLFLLPASLNGIITGSIIGLGDGWEALVATEIIVHVRHGLGGFFQTFSQNISMTSFGILGFLMIIFSLNKIIWLPLLNWSHKKLEE